MAIYSYWPYRILVIGGSASGKTRALLNWVNKQEKDDYNIIDKIYLYVKDRYGPKNWYLINKHKKIGQGNFEDPKAYIYYSNDRLDVY